jgi:hypothetical protein
MMNPSAANSGQYTDHTVMKCGRLAVRWGFMRLLVGNACAYRCTQSKNLLTVDDPVGPDNAQHILDMAAGASRIIIAHGRLPSGLNMHAANMVQCLRTTGKELYVLKLLPDGTPAHPLGRGKGHIPEDIIPKIWHV